VLIPYWIGVSFLGVANSWKNLALHMIGSVAVLVVLLVPPAHEWLLVRIGGQVRPHDRETLVKRHL
jgi:hypothetical protein